MDKTASSSPITVQLFSKKGFTYLLCLFLLLLPFNMLFCNVLTILLLLYVAASTIFHRKILFDGKIEFFVLFTSLFLLQLLGLLYTQDIKQGLFTVEKRLAMLIFPIVFFFNGHKLGIEDVKKLLFNFLLGFTMAFWYCLFHAIYQNYAFNELRLIIWPLFSDSLLKPIDVNHLTYGLLSAFAIPYCIFAMVYLNVKTKGLYLFFIISTVFGMVLLVPKMGIISLLTGLLYILYSIRNRISLSRVLLISGIIISMVVIMLCLPKSKERLRQVTYGYGRNNVINDLESYSATRAGSFYCSLDLIQKYWLVGLGSGGIDAKMTQWYIDRNLDKLIGLDTHNQYFDYLLSFGIVGLLLFLVNLLYPLWVSFKTDFTLYGLFLIIMLISFSTENFLNNNKGIMFFSFFNSLFATILNLHPNVDRKRQRNNL